MPTEFPALDLYSLDTLIPLPLLLPLLSNYEAIPSSQHIHSWPYQSASQEGLGISIRHTGWGGGGGVPTAYQKFGRSNFLWLCTSYTTDLRPRECWKQWKNTWEYHSGGVSKRVNWIPHLAVVSMVIDWYCTILPFVDISVLLWYARQTTVDIICTHMY